MIDFYGKKNQLGRGGWGGPAFNAAIKKSKFNKISVYHKTINNYFFFGIVLNKYICVAV